MLKKSIFLVVLLVLVSNVFGQVITLDSLRKQDANGVPLLLGQTVTVQGTVTTQGELGPPLVYLQSPTAGTAAYDATFGAGVVRGDSVQVTGIVTHYNGLTELQPVSAFNVISTGKTANVVNVTPTQARENGELYEGRLIKISGITAVKTISGVIATNWTTSASGTNYRIFVGTDSVDIRIYTSTNIANTIIPPYPFTVTALESQFDSSTPYLSGYQIIPRSLTDIVTQAVGPTISTVPLESSINPTSITLTYNTISAGDTKIKYFVSDSIGKPVVYTDSLYNAALVTVHTATLTNLVPGKIYYAQVSSTDGTGTSTYGPKYFSTQSHSASTGKMEAYFNYPTEPSVALPNNLANGSANLQTRLIQRIDSAQYSIDLAIYSFDDLTQIKNAMLNAFIRGVKIRIVYDSRTIQPLMQELINSGIRVQQRPTGGALMHNKFFVFDGRDISAAAYARKWVWTGSANITSAQFNQDIENVLFIQDESLSHTYTREFEEMWGSHNDVNNPINAKFGTAKLDNTPHLFNINGKRLDCYFSPSDDIATKVENLITNETNKSINFCIFAFTKFSIENKMHLKYSPPTVMVRGVFDRSTNGNITNGPVYYEMAGLGGTVWNPTAKVYLDNYNTSYLFHDKYILIDADMPSSNPVVETGSYNFSNAASYDNDENVVMVYDSLIANQYYQDFVKRLTDAGGSIGINTISEVVPMNFNLTQNYPNPFNPSTKITFDVAKSSNVKISVFDVLGREVSVLVDRQINAGQYSTEWNAAGYPSGMYFYVLNVNGENVNTKKMVLKK
ncbi:MAG: phospholipase D-like domain-containing protein [Ignavibacteriae bacterium]|nr:phospholipase D-like domain-containing protein [Ignavibacteriota bacterium]